MISIHKKLLLLITISISLAVNAQTGNTPDAYLSYVYKAESSFVHKDNNHAGAFYDSAFAQNFPPFATDIYNYAVCAAYQSNYTKLHSLAAQLILKGADTIFFHKSIFSGFRRSVEWPGLLSSYDSLKTQRTKQQDSSLVKDILSFNQRDQATHSMLAQNAEDEAFIDKMHRQDDSLNESLNALLLAHDYLSEELIGANIHDTGIFFGPIWSTLVLHEFQKSGTILSETIDRAIHLGKIRPEAGLSWMEMSNMVNLKFTSFDFFIYNDTLRRFHFSTKFRSSKLGLLDANPSPEIKEMQKYYHVDSPENIIDKMKFVYRQIIHREKAGDFILPLSVVIIHPKNGIPIETVVIDDGH